MIKGTTGGRAQLFNYISGTNTWNQFGTNIEGEASSDETGFDVSYVQSGSRPRMAVGAPARLGAAQDAAKIYQWNLADSTWTKIASFSPASPTEKKRTGWSVSLRRGPALSAGTGTTVAVGAIFGDGGEVRVHQEDVASGIWNQKGRTLKGSLFGGSSFGWHCALSNDGETLVVLSANVGFSTVLVFKYTTVPTGAPTPVPTPRPTDSGTAAPSLAPADDCCDCCFCCCNVARIGNNAVQNVLAITGKVWK